MEKMSTATPTKFSPSQLSPYLMQLYGHYDLLLGDENDNFEARMAYTQYGIEDPDARSSSEHKDANDSDVQEVAPLARSSKKLLPSPIKTSLPNFCEVGNWPRGVRRAGICWIWYC